MAEEAEKRKREVAETGEEEGPERKKERKTAEEEAFCIYDYVTAPPETKQLRCLKPFSQTVTATFPPLSGTAPYLGQTSRHHLKLYFPGWVNLPTTTKWSNWIQLLSEKHTQTWKQARISNALSISRYHLPPRQDLISSLVEYWCPATNTFVFPWGEATVTLEDIAVLGGFSVLGEPASSPLPRRGEPDNETLETMLDFQIEMSGRAKGSESEQLMSHWMKFFMEEDDDEEEEDYRELEHVAFLSIWLSRFVFPFFDPKLEMEANVFAMAIRLSRGERLALAPAVLAGVYHSLCALKKTLYLPVVEFKDENHETAPGGPFQIVQHWVMERFREIAPRSPRALEIGQPRAAMWHRVKVKSEYYFIDEALKSNYDNGFKWRPYACDVTNWESHYNDEEQVAVVEYGSGGPDSNDSEGLLWFGVCLCACELEGVAGSSKQRYMPHRVARQFGMDQHFPAEFAVTKPGIGDKFRFCVPARSYEPALSVEYSDWWNEQWEEYEERDKLEAEARRR